MPIPPLSVNPRGVSQEPGCIAAFDLIPSGYLSSLIGNPQVNRYLERHHPEVMRTALTVPLVLPGLLASAIFVFLESLDEFTGTYFVGVPEVTTLPLTMFNASLGGNYQIAAITALVLLVPSIGIMPVSERFLKAETVAKIA